MHASMSYFNDKTMSMYQEFDFPNDVYANLTKYWQKCEPLSRIQFAKDLQANSPAYWLMYYFFEVEDTSLVSLLDAR